MMIMNILQCQTEYAKFQKSGNFCDVTLLVNGEKFNCHKVYLAAASEYFKLLFRYDHKREIEINGVSALAFRNVVSFLYEDKLVFDGIEELKDILIAADLFQINSMKRRCGEKFVYRKENCMEAYLLSKMFNCEGMASLAKEQMPFGENDWVLNNVNNFDQNIMSCYVVSEAEEINECVVFDVLSIWTRMDRSNRTEQFCSFFIHIRLPVLGKNYLNNCVGKHEHIMNCKQCKVYVKATATYFTDGRKDNLKGRQLYPRGSPEHCYNITVHEPNNRHSSENEHDTEHSSDEQHSDGNFSDSNDESDDGNSSDEQHAHGDVHSSDSDDEFDDGNSSDEQHSDGNFSDSDDEFDDGNSSDEQHSDVHSSDSDNEFDDGNSSDEQHSDVHSSDSDDEFDDGTSSDEQHSDVHSSDSDDEFDDGNSSDEQ